MPRDILLSEVKQEINSLSQHRLVCRKYGIATDWVAWDQTAYLGGWVSVTRHHRPAGSAILDVSEFAQIMATAVVDSYGVNMLPYLAEDAARELSRSASFAASTAHMSPNGAAFESFGDK